MVSHYNVQRTIDIYASTQGRDLGGVASDIAKITAAAQKQLPKGSTHGDARTSRHDAFFVRRTRRRSRLRDCPGLSADRNQFPVMERSVHHHHRLAGRAGGNRLDAVPDAHHSERTRADGNHHEHGSRDGEQRSGHQLRQ